MDKINGFTSSFDFRQQPQTLSKAMRITLPDTQAVADANEQNTSLQSSGVKVTISDKGQEQLAKEKLGQEIANKLDENSNKNEQVAEEKSADPFDRLIALIKEQIKQVKQQLAKLEGAESEVAEKQRDMLNAQLMELNGQLLAVFEEKQQAQAKKLQS